MAIKDKIPSTAPRKGISEKMEEDLPTISISTEEEEKIEKKDVSKGLPVQEMIPSEQQEEVEGGVLPVGEVRDAEPPAVETPISPTDKPEELVEGDVKEEVPTLALMPSYQAIPAFFEEDSAIGSWLNNTFDDESSFWKVYQDLYDTGDFNKRWTLKGLENRPHQFFKEGKEGGWDALERQGTALEVLGLYGYSNTLDYLYERSKKDTGITNLDKSDFQRLFNRYLDKNYRDALSNPNAVFAWGVPMDVAKDMKWFEGLSSYGRDVSRKATKTMSFFNRNTALDLDSDGKKYTGKYNIQATSYLLNALGSPTFITQDKDGNYHLGIRNSDDSVSPIHLQKWFDKDNPLATFTHPTSIDIGKDIGIGMAGVVIGEVGGMNLLKAIAKRSPALAFWIGKRFSAPLIGAAIGTAVAPGVGTASGLMIGTIYNLISMGHLLTRIAIGSIAGAGTIWGYNKAEEWAIQANALSALSYLRDSEGKDWAEGYVKNLPLKETALRNAKWDLAFGSVLGGVFPVVAKLMKFSGGKAAGSTGGGLSHKEVMENIPVDYRTPEFSILLKEMTKDAPITKDGVTILSSILTATSSEEVAKAISSKGVTRGQEDLIKTVAQVLSPAFRESSYIKVNAIENVVRQGYKGSPFSVRALPIADAIHKTPVLDDAFFSKQGTFDITRILSPRLENILSDIKTLSPQGAEDARKLLKEFGRKDVKAKGAKGDKKQAEEMVAPKIFDSTGKSYTPTMDTESFPLLARAEAEGLEVTRGDKIKGTVGEAHRFMIKEISAIAKRLGDKMDNPKDVPIVVNGLNNKLQNELLGWFRRIYKGEESQRLLLSKVLSDRLTAGRELSSALSDTVLSESFPKTQRVRELVKVLREIIEPVSSVKSSKLLNDFVDGKLNGDIYDSIPEIFKFLPNSSSKNNMVNLLTDMAIMGSTEEMKGVGKVLNPFLLTGNLMRVFSKIPERDFVSLLQRRLEKSAGDIVDSKIQGKNVDTVIATFARGVSSMTRAGDKEVSEISASSLENVRRTSEKLNKKWLRDLVVRSVSLDNRGKFVVDMDATVHSPEIKGILDELLGEVKGGAKNKAKQRVDIASLNDAISAVMESPSGKEIVKRAGDNAIVSYKQMARAKLQSQLADNLFLQMNGLDVLAKVALKVSGMISAGISDQPVGRMKLMLVSQTIRNIGRSVIGGIDDGHDLFHVVDKSKLLAQSVAQGDVERTLQNYGRKSNVTKSIEWLGKKMGHDIEINTNSKVSGVLINSLLRLPSRATNVAVSPSHVSRGIREVGNEQAKEMVAPEIYWESAKEMWDISQAITNDPVEAVHKHITKESHPLGVDFLGVEDEVLLRGKEIGMNQVTPNVDNIIDFRDELAETLPLFVYSKGGKTDRERELPGHLLYIPILDKGKARYLSLYDLVYSKDKDDIRSLLKTEKERQKFMDDIRKEYAKIPKVTTGR